MAFNAQLYGQARQDLIHNWHAAQQALAAGRSNDSNVQHITKFPTMEEYLADDFRNNPNAETQQAQVMTNGQTGPAVVTTNIATDRRDGPALNPPSGGVNNNPIATNGVTSIGSDGVDRTGRLGSTGGGFMALVPGAVTVNTPNVRPAGTPSTTTTDENGNVTTTGGGNYNQIQNSGQTGSFHTVGNTGNQTGGTTIASTNQVGTNRGTQGTTTGSSAVQTGTSTNQGITTNQGVTTNNTTGAFSNKADDSLGFGALLRESAGGVQASDADRQTFLRDTMNTGGTQLNSQVDQAVRRSLSGPGMTGAGESASARAAGYAGAEIGRNNMNQRLAAAGQLSGPTGLATLSTAANPYIGQSGTNSAAATGTSGNIGTNVNTGTTTNATDSTGWQNLVSDTVTSQMGTNRQDTSGWNTGQESTAGNAASGSSSSAAGQIPQSNNVQTSSGGCIICTVGIHHGLWKQKRVLRRVVRYKLQTQPERFRRAALGYFFLFTPLAKLALHSRLVARLFQPIARAVVYEELRVSKRPLPFRTIPWLVHWTWHGLCTMVATVLPVPQTLADKTLSDLAYRHGVLFPFSK